MNNVFLSHKAHCAGHAEKLAGLLEGAFPSASVFKSEDIETGTDWRAKIDNALAAAKCVASRGS
jgi:hypothetical protein